MEDGALTDAEGHEVDFSNVILIFTSNLGARESAEKHPLGFEAARRDLSKDIRQRALSDAFRPEFLNRLDEIVVFDPLDRDALSTIAKNMLSDLKERAASRGITLELSPTLPSLLADEALGEGKGARPLRRAIARKIEDPLSLLMLEHGRGTPCSASVREKDGEILLS